MEKHGRFFSHAIIFLVLHLVLLSSGAARERLSIVHFPAASPENSSQTNNEKLGFPLWGHLGMPAGEGPHPAVVLMHGCGGIQQLHFEWARTLNESGYVTLVVDSFRPRSLIQQCGGGSAAASPAGRILDAYGALRYLQNLDVVESSRVGLMGWSHGGIAALSAVTKNGIGERFSEKFQTVIAFYPHCGGAREFNASIAVLIGASDDWTPAASCKTLKKQTEGHSNELSLTVYPGAFHGFDNPMFGSGFFVPGAPGQKHWLQYNSDAHQKAVIETKRLLEERLR